MFGFKNRRKQLLEEIETHIEIETQQNIEAGMPPEQARCAAKRKFGNVLVAVEQSRSVWGAMWLENLLRDIRYAARSLCAVPGYTVTLLCTLALGLGCVTAMLAIIQSVLLLPVDLPHPGRLVHIYAEDESEGTSASPHALSYEAIDALRRETKSFAGVSGYHLAGRESSPDPRQVRSLLWRYPPMLPEIAPLLAAIGRPIINARVRKVLITIGVISLQL